MSASILAGNKIAAEIRAEAAAEVRALSAAGTRPGLAVDPAKDVDGFHPTNVGFLSTQRPGLVPCTPAGIMEMLERSKIKIAAAEAVVVGRSDIVGKPMAMLLLNGNATVTVCHSKTH